MRWVGAGEWGLEAACVEILAENLLQRTCYNLIVYGTNIRLAVYYVRNHFSPVIPHS